MRKRTPLLGEVAGTGDRLATLQVLRDRLAADLDKADDPRDVAALALRLTDVLQQIESMPNTQQASAADEIAARRAARQKRAPRRGARASG